MILLTCLLGACGLDKGADPTDPLACECDPIDTSPDTTYTDDTATDTATSGCDTAAGDTGCDTGTTAGS